MKYQNKFRIAPFLFTILGVISLTQLFFPSLTKAGIFIEPYGGYGLLGNFTSSGSTTSDSYNGMGVGLRAGLKVTALFFGPDVAYFPSISYTASGSTSNMSPNPKSFKLGAIV